MDFIQQSNQLLQVLGTNAPTMLKMIGILWLVHFINWLVGFRLNILGIYPRHWLGLPGIIFAPFLHADFGHLLFNSLPLFILGSFVLINGWSVFYGVSLTIILLSGLGIWLFGRQAIHIGASALVMGYWSFVLFSAYEKKSPVAIVLAVISIYYFGSFIVGLFPTRGKFSWEGHLCGFIAGIIAAYCYV